MGFQPMLANHRRNAFSGNNSIYSHGTSEPGRPCAAVGDFPALRLA